MGLEGKVALITGGGSGIGRATSLLMGAQGASVLVADIDAESAETVAEIVRNRGGVARSVQCDIGIEDRIAAAVEAAMDSFGRLDILFNNAALMTPESHQEDIDILTIKTDTWDEPIPIGAARSAKSALSIILL